MIKFSKLGKEETHIFVGDLNKNVEIVEVAENCWKSLIMLKFVKWDQNQKNCTLMIFLAISWNSFKMVLL